MEFGEVVKVLRAEQQLSLRRFASGLNEYLQGKDRRTFQTVKNWEGGMGGLTDAQLEKLLNHAPIGSWQRELAHRARAAEMSDISTAPTAVLA